MREKYRIRDLCEPFGKSKQAYYKHDEDLVLENAAMRSFALEYARDLRKQDPEIGILKIWYMYQQEFRHEKSILGRDAFLDLMLESHMRVRNRIRKPKTTDSSHGLPLYPDLTRDVIPYAPNQLWVSDITYITVWMSSHEYFFCYLSLIMDAYTKEIVGWNAATPSGPFIPWKP